MCSNVFLFELFICLVTLNIHKAFLFWKKNFIDCYGCDFNLIVGDFNVDFYCGSSLLDLQLDCPIWTWWLVTCCIRMIFIQKGWWSCKVGLTVFFLHIVSLILCLISTLNILAVIYLTISLLISCFMLVVWLLAIPLRHKVSSTDIDKYQHLVGQYLPTLSLEIISCTEASCSCHNELLEEYAWQCVSTLLDCAFSCLPCFSSSFLFL